METRQDFQESWRLLKANLRAFNSTIIFAIGCSLFTVIVLFGMVVWFYPASDVDTPGRFFIDSYFRWISVAIVFLILNVFINCQTGLAHDIMSSGDMFVEFKSSFYYFRQHWWKYVILSIIMGSPVSSFPQWLLTGRIILFPPDQLSIISQYVLGVFILLIFFIFIFVWNSIFSQSLASINSQGKLWPAIIESIRIFKANPKRVITTWGLYTLIFYSPIWIFEITLRIVELSDMANIWAILSFLLIYALIFIFIGLPMRALIITGLYNNIPFEHYNPKTPTTASKNETESKNLK